MTESTALSRSVVLIVATVFFALIAFDLGEPHPAGPTNYESSVSQIEPSNAGASFRVAGGDAFLVLEAELGREVLVPGYFGEPYVRIDADGLVFVNEDSPAFSINQERYGQVGAPEAVADDDEPRWIQVGTGGSYAWLDHRTHWMSSDLPPAVAGDRRERVFPWEIPVEIDGALATVSGELSWEPSRSPIPALLAGMIVLVPLVLMRRRQSLWLGIVISAGAIVALTATVAQVASLPTSVSRIPIELFYPVLALVAGTLAVVTAMKGHSHADWLSLGASLMLLPWLAGSISVLWLPVLSSSVPPVLERAMVAFVAWDVAAVAALCVARISTRRRRAYGSRVSSNAQPPSAT